MRQKLFLLTPPAAEPVTIPELTTFLRLDTTNAEPAPGALTAALAGLGAGNVDNGDHRYRVTFVTADGETDGGIVSAVLTVANKTVNGQVALTAVPTGGSAVTARKIYRTVAAGSTYLLLTTLADNTTTAYTDNTADAGLGAGAPAVNTTQDPLLKSLLTAARQHIETAILHRALLTQTWQLFLDAFPNAQWFLEPQGQPVDSRIGPRWRGLDLTRLELPMPTLQTVTSVKYIDVNGAQQTMPSGDYAVDTKQDPGVIQLLAGKSWPTAKVQTPNAVTVEYVAGYGVTAASVPEAVKTGIKMLVGELFENRMPPDAAIDELPWLDRLLASHRVFLT